MRRTINLEDPIDRRRYCCPYEHVQWEAWDHHVYYFSCADYGEVEPRFDGLIDKKTGESIPRSEIEFVERKESAEKPAD